MSCYAHREDPERFVDIFNRTVEPVVGRTRISTHLCFGNYKGRAVAPRRYAPMFPAFLGVARRRDPRRDGEPRARRVRGRRRRSPSAPTRPSASIDVKSYWIEPPEEVAARVRHFLAARARRAARLLDRLRPLADGALGGAAEAREPRRRRAASCNDEL